MPVAAQTLTAAQQNMLDQMRFHTQNMIVALSRSGSGSYNSDVLDFQNAGNRLRTTIDSTLRAIGSSLRWVTLVEDGKFGSRTSRAAGYFLPDPRGFPTRASAIPAWYATHSSMVDGMTPPSSGGADLNEVINPPSPNPAGTYDQAAAQSVINSGGSTVMNVVPAGIPAAQGSQLPPGQVVPQSTPQGPPAYGPQVSEVVNSMSPADAATEIINMDFDAEQGSNVVGTRVKSRVPQLATAIGAVGLAGALVYFLKRKKRR